MLLARTIATMIIATKAIPIVEIIVSIEANIGPITDVSIYTHVSKLYVQMNDLFDISVPPGLFGWDT